MYLGLKISAFFFFEEGPKSGVAMAAPATPMAPALSTYTSLSTAYISTLMGRHVCVCVFGGAFIIGHAAHISKQN